LSAVLEPLHFDCIGCQAQTDGSSTTEAVLAVLAVLLGGIVDLETMRADLCFFHRRLVEDAVRRLAGVAEAG
jgi:hypothetical protein